MTHTALAIRTDPANPNQPASPDGYAAQDTSSAYPRLRVRVDPTNPNHHLWNNNGTWFIHYTVHPDALTAVRVRRSLGTAELSEARSRRDAYLDRAHCTAGGGI